MFLISLWVFILALMLVFYLSSKPRNFPPGPPWLPILGCTLTFKKLQKTFGPQHLILQELAKRLKSDIIGFKLGEQIMVSVTSYPLIKAVLLSDDYNARPNSFFGKLRRITNAEGITCAEDELWIEQRGFVVRHLRDLGFGKNGMEESIKNELKDTLNYIDMNNTNINVASMLSVAVINVIQSLVFGIRFEKDDRRLVKFLEILEKRNRTFDMAGGLMSQFPWLRFIMPEKLGYNLIKCVNSELKQFFCELVEEHERTWTEGNNSDLIYSYISQMKQDEGKLSNFTRDQLLMVSLDLFLASVHTTSTMLNVIFVMIMLHPDIQKNVKEAIDKTFPENHELSYSDKQKIPYIDAVISEIERYCYIIPISAARRAVRDTVLEGYKIPKDTTVLVNVHCIFRSKEIWGDPDTFRPSRFLDDQGKYTCPKEFIPFSTGKRRCLGESLARSFLFLFFSEILRKYTVKPSEGTPVPSANASSGIFSMPKQYCAHFVKRN